MLRQASTLQRRKSRSSYFERWQMWHWETISKAHSVERSGGVGEGAQKKVIPKTSHCRRNAENSKVESGRWSRDAGDATGKPSRDDAMCHHMSHAKHKNANASLSSCVRSQAIFSLSLQFNQNLYPVKEDLCFWNKQCRQPFRLVLQHCVITVLFCRRHS